LIITLAFKKNAIFSAGKWPKLAETEILTLAPRSRVASHLDDFHDQVEGRGPPLVQLRKVVLEQPPRVDFTKLNFQVNIK
jgi:hypothetical protein